MMFDAFRPGESIAWDFFWQSTLFLCLGLAASRGLARRPARAHRVLLLAVVAALVTPLLAHAARRGGWGLLTHRAEEQAVGTAAGATDAAAPAIAGPGPTVARVSLSTNAMRPAIPKEPVPSVRITPLHGVHPAVKAPDLALSAVDPQQRPFITWRALALGAWLILGGLAALRLGLGILLGCEVARRARSLDDEGFAVAAARAAARLGLGQPPELRASPRVACPAIWCWRHRPVILLPETAAAARPVDWAGVFCHELAHWVRRDHWSTLLAELATCLLPWHPLVWLARHRLSQLSDLACDDWALSTGLPVTDYAESLLALVPQRRAALALTAVSSRRSLIGRVRHILVERRIYPAVGRTWAILSAVVMLLAASALALAQTRPVPRTDQSRESKPNSRSVSATNTTRESNKETAMKHTIRGTVLGPDDKPVAGASVLLVGYTKPRVSNVAMPRDRQDQHDDPRDVILSKTTSEIDGRYVLAAEVTPDDLNSLLVVAFAPGFGVHARYLMKYKESVDASQLGATERTLRLTPQVPIHGRLLTPSGMPASGVRVILNMIHGNQTQDGLHVGLTPNDDRIPAFWPKPTTTDADGRFVLEGVPRGTYVTLAFWPTDFAVDDVTVNTSGDGTTTPSLRDFEIKPVNPTFTHTLEPARPVQGRVTDKQTGKPLVGLLVEMIPMRQHGGKSFYARTDADGRYRVSGHAGAHWYITTVYPPADSGYLAPNNWQTNWPAGAKFLEKNFDLEKGRIVHGQLIDADSQQPVGQAAVVYQPKRDNPNNRDEYDLRNTVLTDKDGRFAITALPGPGFLAVETSDETYMRVPFTEGNREATFPQGVTAIDVPKEGEPKSVQFHIRKGVPLEARVVDPAGKPVAEFTAFYQGIDAVLTTLWNQGRSFVDGHFRLPNADPARTYRVYFIDHERGFGAVVDLKAEPQRKRPIEVKLQPTAKVRGKLVTKSGSPAQGAQANPMLVIREKKDGEMSRGEIFRNAEFYVNIIGQKAMAAFDEKIKLNPRGEFVIDTLVPGARFYLMGGAPGLEAYVPLPPLKPGEDRDLGTITLKEPKP
jgi:beta-lactamase regulating signal transducer with metallopeptidase domain